MLDNVSYELLIDGIDTIRRVGNVAHDEDEVLERPDEPNHYRNTSTENAASFLGTYVERIKSLDLLPFAHDSWQEFLDCDDALVGDPFVLRRLNCLANFHKALSAEEHSHRRVWMGGPVQEGRLVTGQS